MDFEYGDGTGAKFGCGATLHNVFWYFGGKGSSYNRQVKFQKHLSDIYLLYFRQVKLLDANWNVRSIWTLILKKVHATPSINLIKKSFFASIVRMIDSATREYFCEFLNDFIEFLLSFDGESYQSAGSSEYSHRSTFGMANYLGKALTTGCRDDGYCNVKTELMDMNTLTWSAGLDYPFTSE